MLVVYILDNSWWDCCNSVFSPHIRVRKVGNVHGLDSSSVWEMILSLDTNTPWPAVQQLPEGNDDTFKSFVVGRKRLKCFRSKCQLNEQLKQNVSSFYIRYPFCSQVMNDGE